MCHGIRLIESILMGEIKKIYLHFTQETIKLPPDCLGCCLSKSTLCQIPCQNQNLVSRMARPSPPLCQTQYQILTMPFLVPNLELISAIAKLATLSMSVGVHQNMEWFNPIAWFQHCAKMAPNRCSSIVIFLTL